jgi:hypothetical protein
VGRSSAAALDLRIDELVLHGFAPSDRHALAAAIERELARLFREGGVPPTLLDRGQGERILDSYRLDAGSFAVPHDAPADAVGMQVARAIHRGLGGAPEPAHSTRQSTSPTPEPGGAGR